MANVVVINSSNLVSGTNNSTYQYNFISGAFNVPLNAEICISNMTIPYSWYNVNLQYYNNATFQYTWTVLGVKTTNTIVLPNGYYGVSDINQYLQGQFVLAGQYLIDGNGNNVYYISLQYDVPYYAVQLLSFAVPTSLPSGYTQPVSWLGYPSVASTPQLIILANNFGNLIGFTQGTYPAVVQATNYSALSNTTPNGSPVNSLIIQCSLISNNITMPSNILDSMPITSSYGSNINYQPSYEKWVKLKAGRYASMTITLLDQNLNRLIALDPNVLMTLLIKIPNILS